MEKLEVLARGATEVCGAHEALIPALVKVLRGELDLFGFLGIVNMNPGLGMGVECLVRLLNMGVAA